VKKKVVAVLQIVVTALLLWWVLSSVEFRDRAYRDVELVGVEGTLVQVLLRDGTNATFPESGITERKTLTAQDGSRREVVTIVKKGLGTIVREMDMRVAIPFALLLGLVFCIVPLRLYLLLRVQKLDITFGETLKYSFIGLFFNLVLPGLITGDLFKWYFIAKRTRRIAMTGLILAFDRIIGAYVLFVVAAVVSLFVKVEFAGSAYANIAPTVVWLARVVTVAGIVGAAVLFSRRLHRLFRMEFLYAKLPGGNKLERLHKAILLYRSHVWTLVAVLAISVVIHSTNIVTNFGFGRAMGIEGISLARYGVFIPVIFATIGAIPLSVGGLGLRESMYVLTFKTAGVPEELALNLSFTFYIATALWSLPGALVYLVNRERVSTKAMEAELARGEDNSGDETE